MTPVHDNRSCGLELFLANLGRFQSGEPLYHVVDRAAGY